MKEPNSTKDLDRMLKEAILNGFSLFAWKSFNGVIEICEFKIKAIRHELNELELEIDKNEYKTIADVISGNREIDFHLPESSLSFSAGVKTVLSEKKIKIFIPKEFAFIERRRHERIHPKKTCYFTFKIDTQVIKKPIFDLSLGGLAFILPRTEKMNLSVGEKLIGGNLEILGTKIKLTAVCVSTLSIDRFKLDSLPYGGNKFAFRFIEMNKEDRDWLTSYIAQESLDSKKLKGA